MGREVVWGEREVACVKGDGFVRCTAWAGRWTEVDIKSIDLK